MQLVSNNKNHKTGDNNNDNNNIPVYYYQQSLPMRLQLLKSATDQLFNDNNSNNKIKFIYQLLSQGFEMWCKRYLFRGHYQL